MKYVSIPIPVLFFGMVSCQADKKIAKIEEFRIQEPKIAVKKTNDQMNFNAFSQKVQPDLNIGDEIQFQEEAGTFNILYNANCRFNKKETVQSGYISNPKSARFLSFLNPEQLRLIGDSKDGVRCSFDFIALSPNGSRHYFKLPLVQLKDDPAAAEISLLHPKLPDATTQMTFENWQDHFINLPKSGNSKIFFNCSSGEKVISINQSDRLNLSAAPLQEFSLNWSAGVQTCRISQIQNSVIVATSKNFILFSPNLELPIQRSIVQHPRQANTSFNPTIASPSYLIEIKNPYPYTIYFRLPKQDISITDQSNTIQFPTVFLVNLGGSSFQWNFDQIIALEPQKTLKAYQYMYMDRSNCRIIAASAIHSRNKIQIQRLSNAQILENQLVLNNIDIDPYFVRESIGGEHPDFMQFCARR